MAVKNSKKDEVFIEIRVQGFSRSLITIVPSDIRNSRWLSQFGNDKFEKRFNYAQIWYTAVFEVADHDLAIRLSKCMVLETILFFFLLKTCSRN